VDVGRISQLLSNLVGNAITHGAADQPVRVEATITTACSSCRWPMAARRSRPTPPSACSSRSSGCPRRPPSEGLGLGLYIASEIARAHGGDLGVTSDAAETRFTFRMPLAESQPTFESKTA
jgi:sigma-B regulation protein RsbU (phosphoserine phosphatase)